MRTIETVVLDHEGETRRIEVACGDLTNVGEVGGTNVLVVSAFPCDYTPTEGSLIGALHRKGISVEGLASEKAVDMRAVSSCWLSHELEPTVSGVDVGRILCFEPPVETLPAERVGDIFRSLVPLLSEGEPAGTVAMPLVACGDQATPVDEMVGPLVEAAVRWIRRGLPLGRLLIADLNPEACEHAAEALRAIAKSLAPVPAEAVRPFAYDVFVSYCQKNAREADVLVDHLRERAPNVRVFVDRLELKTGAAWQQQIFEALDASRRVATLFTPDYLTSKVCIEEFNVALIRHREENYSVLFPVYLRSASLPTYMRAMQYLDAREADVDRLRVVAAHLTPEV